MSEYFFLFLCRCGILAGRACIEMKNGAKSYRDSSRQQVWDFRKYSRANLKSVNSIHLHIRPFEGVAYTSNHRKTGESEIHLSTNYIQKYVQDHQPQPNEPNEPNASVLVVVSTDPSQHLRLTI